MSDYRFGVDDYGLNYYPHDGVYDEQEGIDWSKVERVEIDWVDFVRERTCKQEERGWGTEGDHARVWLTCGHDCMVPTVQDLPNYCPNCGAKVKDVDE